MRLEWQQRVRVEYRSAALTQHLVLWLVQIGCSPDLIRMGLAIVDDELTHAELAHEVMVAAGGQLDAPIDRADLALVRGDGEPLEADVLRTCLSIFCLGETVAVPLFRALREPCTVPVARRALDRVLRDEVRHRDFGWSLLDWLLERGADEARAIVERELPRMFARLRATYAPARPRAQPAHTAAERAWGLMPASCYVDALARTLERDYVPRFGRLGVDARRAWAAELTAGTASTPTPGR